MSVQRIGMALSLLVICKLYTFWIDKMTTTNLKNHQESTEIPKLDLRYNTQLMLTSYGLRLIGVVVFSIAFYLIVQLV